jgi:hypothetical protein
LGRPARLGAPDSFATPRLKPFPACRSEPGANASFDAKTGDLK